MRDRVLRVELYCHTEYSFDGHIGYDALLAAAAKRRLDVIAIIDHDTVRGALDYQARLASQGAELRIIVGKERNLADRSHVIGLFLHEPLFGDTLPPFARRSPPRTEFAPFPIPTVSSAALCANTRPSCAGRVLRSSIPGAARKKIARRNRSNSAAGSRSAGATHTTVAMLDSA
jgi:hypothetical protein